MPLKVYYIDDEVGLCQNFEDYFATNHIEITTFTEPEKAIAVSKTNPPDVFFVDFRLPNITGDKVAASLPGGIPKYLITGDINVKSEFKFNAMFFKPYQPEDIQLVLDGLLKIRLTA